MTSDDWNSTSVLLILEDNTALRFAQTRKTAPAPVQVSGAPKRARGIGEVVRSFLPRVSRVVPQTDVLPSGKTVALINPARDVIHLTQ